MTENSYNFFSVGFETSSSSEEEEEIFEESNFELYRNKENFQTIFSNQLFSKEEKYFFPGTYDEASNLITLLCQFKDQKTLFHMHNFPPLLTDKIKNWSYSKLTCSVLYYYLNTEIAKNNLNHEDWHTIADLIQSPAISQDVFCFVKRHNILNFSSKKNIAFGFMNSLMFPPYMTYYETLKPKLEVKMFYRLLTLANVKKSIIRDLIKITVSQKNRMAILHFLEKQLGEKI